MKEKIYFEIEIYFIRLLKKSVNIGNRKNRDKRAVVLPNLLFNILYTIRFVHFTAG